MAKELQSRLPQLLAARNWTLANLMQAAGVGKDALDPLLVGRLRTDGAFGIQWFTLWRICEALGCQPGELLVLEEPHFTRFVKRVGGACTVTVGARRACLLDPADAVGTKVLVTAGKVLPEAVGLWDERALAALLPQLSWPVPTLVETPCTLPQATPRPGAVERRLLQPGVLIGLGSPLVSGLADWALLKIHQTLRAPDWPPFYFVWGHQGPDARLYHRYDGPPQGIAMARGTRPAPPHTFLVTVPLWQEIEAADKGYTYDDAALLMVWPTNKHNGTYPTFVVLAQGFMGPGTCAGASLLCGPAFGNLLADYLTQFVENPAADPQAPVPPLCVVLRVPCQKIGGPRTRDVQPQETQVSVVAVHPPPLAARGAAASQPVGGQP